MQPLLAVAAGSWRAATSLFGSGPGSHSRCRCCLLRACCYARLTARRCRVGQTQRLPVPQPGVPVCSKSPWPWFKILTSNGLESPQCQPGSSLGSSYSHHPSAVLPLAPIGSGTWCQRAACRCERLALLCRARRRALRRCRGGRC